MHSTARSALLAAASEGTLIMLEEVERILKEQEDLTDTGECQTDASIADAENELCVRFPDSFREYIARWGWVSFGPHEYFGLGATVSDVVRHTMQARERACLPSSLIMICDHDGDEFVCIDTKQCSDKDCKVVIWDVPTRTVSRIRAESFESFLISDLRAFLE